MKYTLEERLDIGRRIYEHELTCQQAAGEYGIHKHTAKRYLWIDFFEIPDNRIHIHKIVQAALVFFVGGIARFQVFARVVLCGEQFINTDLLNVHTKPHSANFSNPPTMRI